MRVAIDTTYLMPAIGVTGDGIAPDFVSLVQEAGHEIILSEISLFELMAVGSKRCVKGDLHEEDVICAMSALASDEGLVRVPIWDGEVSHRALVYRRRLSDLLDCIILSTGASTADILITEDAEMTQYPLDLLSPVEPAFRITTSAKAKTLLGLP
jgi:predicted nucleic acid-binding protein